RVINIRHVNNPVIYGASSRTSSILAFHRIEVVGTPHRRATTRLICKIGLLVHIQDGRVPFGGSRVVGTVGERRPT
ncbi:hypothetical protein PMAYCL1PPCAC_28534, partial [Pristionchus mayeri]